MNNSTGMGGMNSSTSLCHYPGRFLGADRVLFLDSLSQLDTLKEFHYQVGNPQILCDAKIGYHHGILMSDLRSRACLLPESCKGRLIRSHLGMQHLDGNRAVHHQMSTAIYLAHTAF